MGRGAAQGSTLAIMADTRRVYSKSSPVEIYETRMSLPMGLPAAVISSDNNFILLMHSVTDMLPFFVKESAISVFIAFVDLADLG
jgi:hypothetical protein